MSKNDFVVLILCCGCAFGQMERQADGGGVYGFTPGICLGEDQRHAIRAEIQAQKRRLQAQGRLKQTDPSKRVSFGWPLIQNPAFDDPDYWGIANFVDHNPAFPNQLKDYQNLGRTYDRSDGYNHAGTDFFIWPFSWEMMEREQVWIVAAADGQIVFKSDGHFDQNCSFMPTSTQWNAVYVVHVDGSVAWYGHMKSGTVTGKQIGDPVVAGEYLGAVGSSGISNGPHLHFEVLDAREHIIDPFAGPGNPSTSVSWWADQIDYYETAPVRLMTHEMPPEFLGRCPGQYAIHRKDDFAPGDSIVYTIYLRDELPGLPITFSVYAPDGQLFQTWTDTTDSTYAASYWYYRDFVPADGASGTWTVEAEFSGHLIRHAFSVNARRTRTERQPGPVPIESRR